MSNASRKRVRDEADEANDGGYALICKLFGRRIAKAMQLQRQLQEFIDKHPSRAFQSPESRTQTEGAVAFCTVVDTKRDEIATVKATLRDIFPPLTRSHEKYFDVEKVPFADMMDTLVYNLEDRRARTRRFVKKMSRADPELVARVREMTGGTAPPDNDDDDEPAPTFDEERTFLTGLFTTGAPGAPAAPEQCLYFRKPDANTEGMWNDGHAFIVDGGKLLLGWYDPSSLHQHSGL